MTKLVLRYDIDLDSEKQWKGAEKMLDSFLRYAPSRIVGIRHKRGPGEVALRYWNKHSHYRYRCLTGEQAKALVALHQRRKMDCPCVWIEKGTIDAT